MRNTIPQGTVEQVIQSDLPLVEKMFALYPEQRPGYGDSKRERKIAARTQEMLYEKRIRITRSILENSFDEPRAVLVSSLVKNGIAPRVVEPWVDWVLFLARYVGGWDMFLRYLADDMEKLDYLHGNIRNSFVGGTLLIYVFIALNAVVSTYTAFPFVHFVIWLVLVSAWIFWMVFHTGEMRSHYKKHYGAFIGKNTKPVKEFLPAAVVKNYLQS